MCDILMERSSFERKSGIMQKVCYCKNNQNTAKSPMQRNERAFLDVLSVAKKWPWVHCVKLFF